MIEFTIEKEKESKKSVLTKAYGNLMKNMWSDKPPLSIAPNSVLNAVRMVGKITFLSFSRVAWLLVLLTGFSYVSGLSAT